MLKVNVYARKRLILTTYCAFRLASALLVIASPISTFDTMAATDEHKLRNQKVLHKLFISYVLFKVD